MGSRPFATSARISAIVHATEDPRKVSTAISNIFPPNFPSKMKSVKAKGHHGNDIQVLELILRNRSDAGLLLETLLSKFSIFDRSEIAENLEQYLDESGHFFLRIDKQNAFDGIVKLQPIEPIRIEFSLGKVRGLETARILEEFLQEISLQDA